MSQCQNCKAMVNPKWAACLSCGAAIQADGEQNAGPVEYPVPIKMDSPILRDSVDVLLWPDRAEVEGLEYSLDEIKALKSRGPSAADLMAVHEAKKAFEGKVIQPDKTAGRN
jgi:hypothetical protein